MKIYLLSALLFFSSLAFCQEKKEAPKSEKESTSKKKGIPPTLLSTRTFFVRYAPKAISLQDTKQNDIQRPGVPFLTLDLGVQWFKRNGNILNLDLGFTTGGLGGSGASSTFIRSTTNYSYLFDVKKYNGWAFYLGPEVKSAFLLNTAPTLTNNQIYLYAEIPVMLRLSAVKEIKKQVFRFDLGLSVFSFVSENNSFGGNLYKTDVENGQVDYRTAFNSPSNLFSHLEFATINKYFKVYTNITYQLSTRFQFNYLWSYSSFSALSNYPTRFGEHNLGVTFLFGRMKKTN